MASQLYGRNPLVPELKPSLHDSRTIILAPTGKDTALIAGLLARRGMPCHAAASVEELCLEIGRGAGAAILSEEALSESAILRLRAVIDEQPPWSDFPLIVLTVGGRVTIQSERLRTLRQPLGNVFLLERPIRPETLLSTLEIALRGRLRQYQIREQIAQYSQAQEALRRSEKLAVTGRLAASIAHEINNPLEAVTNLLYLMRDCGDGDQAKGYLEAADQELARVAEITRHTLRFYREPSHPVDTQVETVLRSVLVLYHSRMMAAGVEPTVEILARDATVLASPGELRQVIANIVGNAIDAMRHGGRLRLRLRVDSGRAGQQVRLTIGDTGSGIPQELLPTIFEPFVTTKGETGTGLGLWVTGEILRRNGWTMQVRTRTGARGSGTVFSLVMPTIDAATAAEDQVSAAVA